MIKLIRPPEYKKSLWKNGQGTTEEIFIYPETAKFPEDDFVFRLSSATIQSQNEFSLFPRYKRLLTVVEGKGLLLNDEPLLKNEVLKFSGSEKIKCTPYASQIIDLGLIFDEDLVNAKMTILQFGEMKLPLEPENEYFLFCAEGLIFAGSLHVRRFETLYLAGERSIQLSSPDVIAVLISIAFK